MNPSIKSSRTLRLCQSLVILAALSGCAVQQSKPDKSPAYSVPDKGPAYSMPEPALQPGIYAENYVGLVENTASWLAPIYFAGLAADTITTDDMERTAFEMIEKGYVMIGYTSVNSREAGIDRSGWIGSAHDAAVWAGADVAVVKKDFSHTATVQVAAQVPLEFERENMQTTGRSQGTHGDSTTSSDTETSNTHGVDKTDSNWHETGWQWEAHGEISVIGGPGGGGGEHGSDGDGDSTITVDSTTTSQRSGQSRTAGGSREQRRDNTVRERTLWIAQMIEKEVDHYDHLVTFWRKVVPDPLGATASDLPLELRRELQTNRGVLVLGTVMESPAYLADLLGDDVLLALNGVRIRNTDHLYQLTRAHAGQTVELARWRDGETTTVTVPLLALEQTGPKRNSVLEVEFTDTSTLDHGLRDYLYQHYRNAELKIDEGALIKRVYPASTAARSGFRPGDVVLEIGGEKTAGSRQLSELLRRYSGQTVPIKLLRKGEPSTVQVAL